MAGRSLLGLLCAGALACAACGCPKTTVAAPAPQPSVDALLPGSAGWWRGQTFYEVFVRSFADSNGDGVGDLRGLVAHLDDLNDGKPGGNDLGVDALWLMPISPSPSYHGYDVTDYRDVNPDYGTLADFDLLVREAHRRGMRVILDFVLNHSSSEHPWFRSARRGPASPYRDWYLWRQDPPAWGRPWDGAPVWHGSGGSWFYGLFWSGMPDLNLGNPAVEAEMLSTMRFWLQRGADGFRVDAARHLFETPEGKLVEAPESHAIIKRMRKALEPGFPHVLLVAEAWTDASTVATYAGQGDEFQLAFGFETAAALKMSVKDGNPAELDRAVRNAATVYTDPGFEAPFLSNHDMPRVMRELGGDARKMRAAAAILLALPGTPFLYYGEELGLQGGPAPRDEDKRTPMRWTAQGPHHGFTAASRTWYGTATEAEGVDVASERASDGSLWRLYQRLLTLRHAHPALATGKTTRPTSTGGGRGLFALERVAGAERILMVVNLGVEASGPFTVATPGAPDSLFAEGLGGAPRAQAGGIAFDGLQPQGFAFIALK